MSPPHGRHLGCRQRSGLGHSRHGQDLRPPKLLNNYRRVHASAGGGRVDGGARNGSSEADRSSKEQQRRDLYQAHPRVHNHGRACRKVTIRTRIIMAPYQRVRTHGNAAGQAGERATHQAQEHALRERCKFCDDSTPYAAGLKWSGSSCDHDDLYHGCHREPVCNTKP